MLAWVAGFLIALSVHEAAHAAVANYLGDPTAKFAGRISLNPLKHLDPAGTIFLLFMGFGWGKPVPINPQNFANRRAGEILTSLAGPLANFTVALILAIPHNLLDPGSTAFLFVQTAMFVNVIIMVFNLLPIPPLDGGGVAVNFLPAELAEKYRRNGPIFLFGLIAFDWVFKTSILWGILGTLINIVFAAINLSTTLGG
ncbi:site-2 protease family protein [Patescibacteria group bacterium]|nr:site-2 protease family protein [Patescibacteria group bacterium]